MRRLLTHQGFTLAELVVVAAIISIIVSITFVGLQNLRAAAALRAAGSEVYGALTDAREKTLSSRDDTVYGVRLASTSITRFTGSTYSAGASTNITYAFESGVTATGSAVQNGTSIVFRRLTGEPNATGTVYLRGADGTGTTTLRINTSGLIEYE